MTAMDDGLKQRLLGALILLALAVIFIPVLFDRERMEPINTTSQVPPRPEVKMLEVPEPRKPDWSQPVTAPRQQFVPEPDSAAETATLESTTSTAKDRPGEQVGASRTDDAREPAQDASSSGADPKAEKNAPAVDERTKILAADGTPNAWVLQVGSFQSEDLAIGVRERLIGMGHPAYLHRLELDEKPVFRVYVGPKVKKAPLEKLKPEIDKALQVNSLLLKFKAG